MVTSLMEAVRRPFIAPQVSQETLVEQVRTHLRFHFAEKELLDKLHTYYRGEQAHPSIPGGVAVEARRLAEMSRVNILDLIIASLAQSMYVDGFRAARQQEDAPAWQNWQANKLDSRQNGVYRAALAYGVSYVTVLPGDPVPVIRGHSPRRMVALYGNSDDWPQSALQIIPSGENWMLRLYDDRSIHTFATKGALLDASGDIEFMQTDTHDAGVVPVIRFLNTHDLDEDNQGEIEQLIPIQDQIDDLTFGMLVAARYAAFRQRWIIGWTADSEEQTLKAAASRLWTFEDAPETVKIGEFEQTDLAGYIDARKEALKHASSLAQVPAHELIGELVNLSAEALVAAESAQRRKVVERQMSFGESWEQVLALAGKLAGQPVDEQSQVRWRDTESRAFSATVDALGKAATMLGVPVQELWERIPGVTQQDVERWKAAAAQSDPVSQLNAILERQSTGNTPALPAA